MAPRVSYIFDGSTGAYSYHLLHPMKPHRIKMAHDLIVGYGLDRHMDVVRPLRASAHSMTALYEDISPV